MEMVEHTIERFFIHLFSGAAVLMLSQVGFAYWERKWERFPTWLLHGWFWFIVPGLAAFAAVASREIFDVAAGGPAIKSYFDYLSWILGIGLASWGRLRTSERTLLAMDQIRRR